MKKSMLVFLFIAFASTSIFSLKPTAVPSFNGAEGFGSFATGGRGGKVIYVENLNTSGFGSLDSALNVPGPAYILFKVSGIISGIAVIRQGNKTIAGQTSPGGIIVRGLHFTSNGSKSDDSLLNSNVIIRHMRSRGADDALRVIYTRNVIIDHCSFSFADDECAQISYVSNLSIQNCIFSETNGTHYNYGGMLVNYSNQKYPLDSLSVHHNLFMRIHSRLPECNCNERNDSAWCQGRNFKFEFSNNLYWDPGYPIIYSNFSNYNTKVHFSYSINSVNNYFKVRNDFVHAMFAGPNLTKEENTNMYFSGNKMSLYPEYQDYYLIYCCNNFPSQIGKDYYVDQPAKRLSNRLPYPNITYTRTDSLRSYMIDNVGNFPRDSMERRYEQYLVNDIIDSTDRSSSLTVFNDAFHLDWKSDNQPIKLLPKALVDSDQDGMPDSWEDWNGLNKKKQDHNGFQLSGFYYPDCDSCYTNLEVYLNMLSDSLIMGSSINKGDYLGPNYRTVVKKTSFNSINHIDKNSKIIFYSIDGRKLKELNNLEKIENLNDISKGIIVKSVGDHFFEKKIVLKNY